MDDKNYSDKIERLENERDLLLNQLSDEERAQFELFRKGFSESRENPRLQPEPEIHSTEFMAQENSQVTESGKG